MKILFGTIIVLWYWLSGILVSHDNMVTVLTELSYYRVPDNKLSNREQEQKHQDSSLWHML